MGNRIGIIFHENWQDFSPLLYSHYGAELIPFQLQQYIKNYYQKYDMKSNDGHLYNPSHMMAGFINYLAESVHIRVENLTKENIDKLQSENKYLNSFDGGCWIINVSKDNYGETVVGDNYWLENGNILNDRLRNDYEE